MQTEYLLIFLAIAAVAAILFLVLRRRDSGTEAITEAPAAPAIEAIDTPAAEPHVEGHGIADSVAAAAEDVADQLLQIDSHHDLVDGPADDLTRMKGLGPKAAALLTELGVRRYAQIAAWNDDDVARYDAQLGAFRGRITRDRWVEQARLLSVDDVAGFEAEFGKLAAK